jgi:hypothetical protein
MPTTSNNSVRAGAPRSVCARARISSIRRAINGGNPLAASRRHIVKKIIILALAAAALASPAFAAVTQNAVTQNGEHFNGLGWNALNSNSLTNNALNPNSIRANGSMTVTGKTVHAITLPSGERIPLR